MTWNYRIIKRDLKESSYFAVHEVFYDDKGKITSWTADPIDLTAESPKEIKRMLQQIVDDVNTPALVETKLLAKVRKSK